MLVIISNVDEYNSHFSVMVYPFSADDHNQHLRGIVNHGEWQIILKTQNCVKIKKWKFRMPYM